MKTLLPALVLFSIPAFGSNNFRFGIGLGDQYNTLGYQVGYFYKVVEISASMNIVFRGPSGTIKLYPFSFRDKYFPLISYTHGFFGQYIDYSAGAGLNHDIGESNELYLTYGVSISYIDTIHDYPWLAVAILGVNYVF